MSGKHSGAHSWDSLANAASPGQLPDPAPFPPAPDDAACFALWRKYKMLDNIERHSLRVAEIAEALAKMACLRGIKADCAAARAAGLLHDIAKTWCIANGGAHAMLGAAWIAKETGHFGIAQAVLLHVRWPWQLPRGAASCSTTLFTLYADKRVRHDQCVTIDERFDDILARYAKTDEARAGIMASWQQTQEIEAELSRQLGVNLHEYPFDCGRLVERA